MVPHTIAGVRSKRFSSPAASAQLCSAVAVELAVPAGLLATVLAEAAGLGSKSPTSKPSVPGPPEKLVA